MLIQVVYLMRVRRTYSNGREQHGPRLRRLPRVTAPASDRFGDSVAIDGTTVVVGAGTKMTIVYGCGCVHVYEKVYVGPTLTYDNANKLSLTGVTTPSSNLTVGTNTYDIGSAKDVYIKDQGTYTFHTNDGDQALILNKTVSSDPSGSVPGEGHVTSRIPPWYVFRQW